LNVGRTVFALFDDVLATQRVAAALERDGYDRGGVSILAPDPRGRYARQPAPNAEQRGARIFAPVAINGLGAAAVTGPLTGVLGGAGSSADLIESLRSVGFADPDARHYYESLRRGQALIAVQSPDDRVENAVEVMRRLGARAVDDTAFDGAAAFDGPAPAAAGERAPVAAPSPPPAKAPAARESVVPQVTVPVVEEQLEVGKRQVSRGGVRINSQIVEEPVEESVSLREERLVVERRPVYRDATEADLADFKEGTIEIHETVEEPVIVKKRRVVEEIVIGRETRERTERISETLRRTQVRVEPIEEGPAHRYGESLARDERFRGAEWREVEPTAQREWDEQNAGPWDQFKDSVRGAWQRVSGK
jgi:uncharacterized protein (TIGR02271 family)